MKANIVADGKEKRRLEPGQAPLYVRLEHEMRRRISSGEWKAGTMLPGRKRLSDEYDVHVQTVERAVNSLVDAGILETQGTRGTFVASSFVETQEAVFPTTTLPSHVGSRVTGETAEKLAAGATIGVVSVDDLSPQCSAVLLSLEKTLSTSDATVNFLGLDSRREQGISIRESILRLFDAGANAVVVLMYHSPLPEELSDLLQNPNRPIICVSSTPLDRPGWNVHYDSFDAGYQAARHLLQKGCSEYLYLAGQHVRWADERLEGMMAALRHDGVDPRRLRVRFADDGMLIGSNAIGRCGEIASEEFSVRVPDGIIAANDHIARKVVEAAARHNLKAGSDFLLVGFDDWVDSQAHGISSMRPPIEELGQVAAKLALRAIAGDTTYQRVCLCSHLLKRNSTSGTFRRTPEV